MRVIKIAVNLSIGYANTNRSDEIDVHVEDGASDEEIQLECQAAYEDWSANYIEGGWNIVDAQPREG